METIENIKVCKAVVYKSKIIALGGNSLGLNIPRELVLKHKLNRGDEVVIAVSKVRKITTKVVDVPCYPTMESPTHS